MDNIFENLTPVEELAIELFQQCIENKQLNLLECDDIEGVFKQYLDIASSIEKVLKDRRVKKDVDS